MSKIAIQSGARAVIAERLTYFDVPSKTSGKWSPNYSKSLSGSRNEIKAVIMLSQRICKRTRLSGYCVHPDGAKEFYLKKRIVIISGTMYMDDFWLSNHILSKYYTITSNSLWIMKRLSDSTKYTGTTMS